MTAFRRRAVEQCGISFAARHHGQFVAVQWLLGVVSGSDGCRGTIEHEIAREWQLVKSGVGRKRKEKSGIEVLRRSVKNK